jgi:hypothetical protein
MPVYIARFALGFGCPRWPNAPSREGEGAEPLDGVRDVLFEEFDPNSTASSLLQLALFGNDPLRPHAVSSESTDLDGRRPSRQ